MSSEVAAIKSNFTADVNATQVAPSNKDKGKDRMSILMIFFYDEELRKKGCVKFLYFIGKTFFFETPSPLNFSTPPKRATTVNWRYTSMSSLTEVILFYRKRYTGMEEGRDGGTHK